MPSGLRRGRNVLLTLLGVLALLAFYEILSLATGRTFLPDLFLSFAELGRLFLTASLWKALGYSLLRLLISYSAALFLGVLLGLLAGYYDPLAKFLSPLVTVLRALPSIAVLLLLVVYVPHFSLYVVFLLLFPVLYQAALEGSSEVYHRFEDELRLKGKEHLSNLWLVLFPLSQDYILLGMIQALGLGLKGEVMSETFAYRSDFEGIGKMIYLAYQDVDYGKMMALVLFVVLFSLLLDGLLLLLRDRVEKRIGISKEKQGKAG